MRNEDKNTRRRHPYEQVILSLQGRATSPRTLGELKSEMKPDNRPKKQVRGSIVEIQPVQRNLGHLILRVTFTEDIVTLYINTQAISFFQFNIKFLSPISSRKEYEPIACDHPLHLTAHEQKDSDVLNEHFHIGFKKKRVNLQEFFSKIETPVEDLFSSSFRAPHDFDRRCLLQPNMSAAPQPFDSFYVTHYDDYRFEIPEIRENNFNLLPLKTLFVLWGLLLLGLAVCAGYAGYKKIKEIRVTDCFGSLFQNRSQSSTSEQQINSSKNILS